MLKRSISITLLYFDPAAAATPAAASNKCNDRVVDETLGQTSIALNFSHQLNPNLVISQ